MMLLFLLITIFFHEMSYVRSLEYVSVSTEPYWNYYFCVSFFGLPYARVSKLLTVHMNVRFGVC